MNSTRIEEIQKKCAYPESKSVANALFKVWNETIDDMTTDIETSYEGCHPKIKAALLRGEHIECETFNGLGTNSGRHKIIAYIAGAPNPYRTHSICATDAEPVQPTEWFALPAPLMILELVKRKYKVSGTGIWYLDNDRFTVDAWQWCGKKINKENWQDWQIEEKPTR